MLSAPVTTPPYRVARRDSGSAVFLIFLDPACHGCAILAGCRHYFKCTTTSDLQRRRQTEREEARSCTRWCTPDSSSPRAERSRSQVQSARNSSCARNGSRSPARAALLSRVRRQCQSQHGRRRSPANAASLCRLPATGGHPVASRGTTLGSTVSGRRQVRLGVPEPPSDPLRISSIETAPNCQAGADRTSAKSIASSKLSLAPRE